MEMSQPIKRESLQSEEQKPSEARIEGVPELERYREALVMFVGAEFDAGATREEIEKFHQAQMAQGYSTAIPSRTHGSERMELDAAVKALRNKYDTMAWRIISNWHFDDALDAHENVSKIYKNEESEAA